jgi:predicted Zn-dependent protease with MMP-like domain
VSLYVESPNRKRNAEFRKRIRNVAVLVEDLPPNQRSLKPGKQGRLLLGVFHGVPTTKKSVFDLPSGPDHIVLQENIGAVCSSETAVCEQICLTVIHEPGHYFGLDEEQLTDVWRLWWERKQRK